MYPVKPKSVTVFMCSSDLVFLRVLFRGLLRGLAPDSRMAVSPQMAAGQHHVGLAAGPETFP